MDKLKIDKVILKALNLNNKIELIKDGWRYIKPEDVPKYKARGYIVERGPRGGWRVKVSDSGRPVKEGKKPSGITFDRSVQNFIRSAELFGVKDKLVNELKDFMSDNEDKSNEAYFRIRQMLRDMKREGHIDSKQYNRLANGIRDAYKRKFGELPAKKKLKEAKEKVKPKEEKIPDKRSMKEKIRELIPNDVMAKSTNTYRGNIGDIKLALRAFVDSFSYDAMYHDSSGYDAGNYWNRTERYATIDDGIRIRALKESSGYTYSISLPSAGRSSEYYELEIYDGKDYVRIGWNGVISYTSPEILKVAGNVLAKYGISWAKRMFDRIYNEVEAKEKVKPKEEKVKEKIRQYVPKEGKILKKAWDEVKWLPNEYDLGRVVVYLSKIPVFVRRDETGKYKINFDGKGIEHEFGVVWIKPNSKAYGTIKIIARPIDAYGANVLFDRFTGTWEDLEKIVEKFNDPDKVVEYLVKYNDKSPVFD